MARCRQKAVASTMSSPGQKRSVAISAARLSNLALPSVAAVSACRLTCDAINARSDAWLR